MQAGSVVGNILQSVYVPINTDVLVVNFSHFMKYMLPPKKKTQSRNKYKTKYKDHNSFQVEPQLFPYTIYKTHCIENTNKETL